MTRIARGSLNSRKELTRIATTVPADGVVTWERGGPAGRRGRKKNDPVKRLSWEKEVKDRVHRNFAR